MAELELVVEVGATAGATTTVWLVWSGVDADPETTTAEL